MMYKKLFLALSVITCPLFSEYRFSDYPLMNALANKQSPAKIKRLIERGENVNEVEVEFLRCVNPVLRYGLDHGTSQESVEIIKMLVDAGADVNRITYNRVPDKQVYGMMPLLTYAAIYSSAEVVQVLKEAGAQDKILPNQDSMYFQKSALAIAQELGKTDVAKVLEPAK